MASKSTTNRRTAASKNSTNPKPSPYDEDEDALEDALAYEQPGPGLPSGAVGEQAVAHAAPPLPPSIAKRSPKSNMSSCWKSS